ncbi:alkaline phosphatase family protein [Pelagicoccus sp. SDUM812002]|uniref:alkaline phosphatase family protein n=1 Tax=Pelagicoccus sp. SDUM812002 TaxID=3041266 RepID=UPI00280E06EF|nr:alkaline phosphatase family protein [Pelagicoccus sp. SDUM812002]MDQ8186836.1 alkaline phosphatase family protein [Pelagicoccus sp. SDUM812002]
MKEKVPTLVLGLDAVEIEVIDRLIASGKMPRLEALKKGGKSGRLVNQPPYFLSLVWSSFFTSSHLGDHGWYFNKLWRSEKQRIEYADSKWLSQRPFWEDLDDELRVAILDLPYVSGAPKKPNQTIIGGWQCHDDFGRLEKPAGEWGRLERILGKARMEPEVFGPQSVDTLLALRKESLESLEQFTDLAIEYVKAGQHDLIMAVFGSLHRATHYLWDLTQVDTAGAKESELKLIEGARDELFVAMDAALGRILDSMPEPARVIAFALHGMGPNLGWYEYLPRMVECVHNGGQTTQPAKKGLVFRLKKALPWTWVRQVTRRIPHAWNQALVPVWSRRMYDWSKTRYFSLPMDYNGYVRLNVKGRELEGALDPAEIDAEVARLEEGLKSFRDIETGRKIVKGVVRVESLVGENAPKRNVLPDVIVLWEADFPTAESCGVRSDLFGEIRWPKGQKLVSGRSGNHTPRGWFVASGPGIGNGTVEDAIDPIDLAPTLLDWLGAPRNEKLKGNSVADQLR